MKVSKEKPRLGIDLALKLAFDMSGSKNESSDDET